MIYASSMESEKIVHMGLGRATCTGDISIAYHECRTFFDSSKDFSPSKQSDCPCMESTKSVLVTWKELTHGLGLRSHTECARRMGKGLYMTSFAERFGERGVPLCPPTHMFPLQSLLNPHIQRVPVPSPNAALARTNTRHAGPSFRKSLSTVLE